jgi:hypothetical protein
MAKFNREELLRILQSQSSGSALRAAVPGRDADGAFNTAMKQSRAELFRDLDGELKRAGVDIRRLQVLFARSRQREREARAAMRAAVASSLKKSTVRDSQSQSLRSQAGRVIRLDQPVVTVFDHADLFLTAGTVGSPYETSTFTNGPPPASSSTFFIHSRSTGSQQPANFRYPTQNTGSGTRGTMTPTIQ